MNLFDDLITRRAAANDAAQRVLYSGKQTRTNLTISSQTDPGTRSAEWLRHRRDVSNLSRTAVREPESRRRIGSARNVDAHEREALIDAFPNLFSGNNIFARPLVSGIQRHELDESHLHIVFTRERGEIRDFILVVTTHNHRIDLYRLEFRSLRRRDSSQNLV